MRNLKSTVSDGRDWVWLIVLHQSSWLESMKNTKMLPSEFQLRYTWCHRKDLHLTKSTVTYQEATHYAVLVLGL